MCVCKLQYEFNNSLFLAITYIWYGYTFCSVCLLNLFGRLFVCLCVCFDRKIIGLKHKRLPESGSNIGLWTKFLKRIHSFLHATKSQNSKFFCLICFVIVLVCFVIVFGLFCFVLFYIFYVFVFVLFFVIFSFVFFFQFLFMNQTFSGITNCLFLIFHLFILCS